MFPTSLLLLLVLPVAPVAAQVLDPFNYGAFTKSATWAVANQLGFFESQGLNVSFIQVPSSPSAFASLLAGDFAVLTATIDNAVNFRFNQNATVTVLGQLDLGPDLVVASIPSVTSIQQLQGAQLMVDAPTSGFAFVLEKILGLHGLSMPLGDYSFQTVGATNTRFANLANGTSNGVPAIATILTFPFTAQAQALSPPLNILARVSDFVAPFSSSAFTVRTDAVTDDPAAPLVRFMAAFLGANAFLADPRNAACATLALSRELNVTHAVAAAEYAAARVPATGEIGSATHPFEVSRQGLLNVIDVRSAANGFGGAGPRFDFADAVVPGTGKLVDYTVRDAAVKIVGRLPVRCTLL